MESLFYWTNIPSEWSKVPGIFPLLGIPCQGMPALRDSRPGLQPTSSHHPTFPFTDTPVFKSRLPRSTCSANCLWYLNKKFQDCWYPRRMRGGYADTKWACSPNVTVLSLWGLAEPAEGRSTFTPFFSTCSYFPQVSTSSSIISSIPCSAAHLSLGQPELVFVLNSSW